MTVNLQELIQSQDTRNEAKDQTVHVENEVKHINRDELRLFLSICLGNGTVGPNGFAPLSCNNWNLLGHRNPVVRNPSQLILSAARVGASAKTPVMCGVH